MGGRNGFGRMSRELGVFDAFGGLKDGVVDRRIGISRVWWVFFRLFWLGIMGWIDFGVRLGGLVLLYYRWGWDFASLEIGEEMGFLQTEREGNRWEMK